MKRLAISVSLLVPLVASCQGGYPTQPTPSELEAIAVTTSGAIQRGEVSNAVSGTVALPISLKSLAGITEGAPPITIHAFRTTGQLIREATVSLFWKDDRSVGFVVDGVPTDHTIVLAATIEPGVVLRTLVPKSSRERPSRGQVIDTTSETVVIEAYLAGLIPPVGLGGMAEVVSQGGLNPAAAALLNLQAADTLRQVGATVWAQRMAEAGAAADALKALADAQLRIAQTLNGGTVDVQAVRVMGSEVFLANSAAKEKLAAFKAKVEALAGGQPAGDATAPLERAAALLQAADKTDVPASTEVVPATGSFHLAQVPPGLVLRLPFPYKETQPSKINLGKVYHDLKYLASSEGGFSGPNGGPFTEAEIDAAFESGQGPYRTRCSQIAFNGTRNCTVVTNPADKSREVLITRQAESLDKNLLELEAAFASNDEGRLRQVLRMHPALLNFIADDQGRWTSPVGTWRLRLLQDTGDGLGGPPGYAVLSDTEMYIQAPRGRDGTHLKSGTFLGIVSLWMPSNWLGSLGADVLNNFSMRFEWNSRDNSLMAGEIRGDRRELGEGGTIHRFDYSASFEGKMLEGNRIRGFWFNDEKDMAGRFEMIRGTARYSI